MDVVEYGVVKKMSHKQYKAHLKKEKRRQQRQAIAKLQAEQEAKTVPPQQDDSQEDAARLAEVEEEQEKKEEEERRSAHQAWLERERQAQEVFEQKRLKEEAKKQKLIEEQRRIQEEWEARQEKENHGQSKKDRELQVTLLPMPQSFLALALLIIQPIIVSRGEILLEAQSNDVLQQLDKEIAGEADRPTHNPEAPRQVQEAKRDPCPFFMKTGGCRFGDRCSRAHPQPAISSVLLLPHMYTDFTMEQSHRDEYDTDMSLEYDEGDAYERFLDFYEDALPEFKDFGTVVQFKVCCNWEPHLRGNVYVQYKREEDSSKARDALHGRFYAGKQLSCIYTPVSSWKAAICGMFHKNKCSRGKNCNFLHVFQNPKHEFADADRDYQVQNSRGGWSERGQRYDRDRRHRDRSRSRDRDRHWDQRQRSRSRSPNRRHESEQRSRRRESSRRHRSRSRSRTRRRASRSRSRSRSRSPSRSRRRRSRSGSRSRRRSSRSPRRSRKRNTDDQSHRDRDRSRSPTRHRRSPRRSRSRSPSLPTRTAKDRRSISKSRDSQQSSSDSDDPVAQNSRTLSPAGSKTRPELLRHRSRGNSSDSESSAPENSGAKKDIDIDTTSNRNDKPTIKTQTVKPKVKLESTLDRNKNTSPPEEQIKSLKEDCESDPKKKSRPSGHSPSVKDSSGAESEASSQDSSLLESKHPRAPSRDRKTESRHKKRKKKHGHSHKKSHKKHKKSSSYSPVPPAEQTCNQ